MALEKVNEYIIADDYVRQRALPRYGDPLYLHLNDLREGMELVRTDERVKLLDYGCGGSPYRGLFPNAEYRRADYLATEGLDYSLGENSLVDEKSEFFDVVLSTQVLEHVQQPQMYLSEAYRLLRPGGTFICSTHGVYEEHGCPFDFHRWTADGLRAECEKTGFAVHRIIKMTTGPRALLFLFELYRERFAALPQEPFGNILRDILTTIHSQQGQFHQWCDAVFPDFKVTDSMAHEHAFYIALLLIGTKPAATLGEESFRFTRHSNPD